jgi:DNA-binding transcriptional LysR family regulator
MAELTLTGLRVLREVAAHGSFTAAAESLGYTQSAVSRQVASLEAAAGTPLFTRGSRGVQLTEAGRLLLAHTDGVLDRVDSAQRELAGVGRRVKGRLRVGAFHSALAALIPRAIARFRAHHPEVEVALREGTTPSQLKRVSSGAADLAVVGSSSGKPPTGERLAFEPLMDDPLLLAVARDHPLARKRSVEPDDLAGETWIARGATPDENVLGIWPSLEDRARVSFVASDWTAKLGLVAAGLGVTVVPGVAAGSMRGDVTLLRVRGEHAQSRLVSVATRVGAELAPPVAPFIQVLHQVAAEMSVELERRIREG